MKAMKRAPMSPNGRKLAEYARYRSLVYPLIEFAMSSEVAKRVRFKNPLMSPSAASQILQQWDRGADEGKANFERAKHITSWGDYAQLEYTSALCILVGTLTRVITVSNPYVLSWPVVALVVLLAAGGLIADWRLRAIQEYMQHDET